VKMNQPGGTGCQARARACHLASTYMSSIKSIVHAKDAELSRGWNAVS
jgi:hypothetical protein